MAEQMTIENEKLKEDCKEKGYKLAPKVIDEDSKANNLEEITNKIVTDFKKVDQLINNVFYQKESCSNFKRTITAIEVAKLFWYNIVCNYGLPLTIVCDNDKLFTAEIWSQMLEEAGVIMKTTVPGRAQSDGQTERANRVIKEICRCSCSCSCNYGIVVVVFVAVVVVMVVAVAVAVVVVVEAR
ncbi:hypothetical protein ACTA71_004461 [Dictyostelium dimigraforme]